MNNDKKLVIILISIAVLAVVFVVGGSIYGGINRDIKAQDPIIGEYMQKSDNKTVYVRITPEAISISGRYTNGSALERVVYHWKKSDDGLYLGETLSDEEAVFSLNGNDTLVLMLPNGQVSRFTRTE